MTKATKTESAEMIHFRLGERSAIWSTPDGTISLSKFQGKVFGKISPDKDMFNWPMVLNALRQGILVKINEEDSKKSTHVEKLVDIAEQADTKNNLRREAIKYLRGLVKEKLIERIDEIKNPNLIAMMIEQENLGRNVSRRKREEVIMSLKHRLDILMKDSKTTTTMVGYTEVPELVEGKYKPEV